MGWFGPRDNCGCCDCECPTGRLYYTDDCLVVWECFQCGEEPTGATFTLTSDSHDYGAVESSGSVNAVYGDTYTLTITKPGCTDRVYTLTVDSECPCPTGCLAGPSPSRVLGAKPIATIQVWRFGSYTQVQPLGLSTLGCSVTRHWDFTDLNHTASFAVKQLVYDNRGATPCIADYIEPQEYYIADTTLTETWSDGYTSHTASVTYAVYGVVPAVVTIADGITPFGIGYHLKFVRINSSPYTGTICTGQVSQPYATGTFYVRGDSSASSLEYGSYHCHAVPPDYLNSAVGSGGCSNRHYHWCELDNDYGDEIATWGVPEWMGVGDAPGLKPVQLTGVFQWDSLY